MAAIPQHLDESTAVGRDTAGGYFHRDAALLSNLAAPARKWNIPVYATCLVTNSIIGTL